VKTLILFYSRTGTTQVVANALATALDATIARIECPKYKGGWFRYLLAGYDSVKGRLPPIDVPDLAFRDYDAIILGTPIWTSYPALPMRSFLSGKPDLPDRVSLFLTYGGHSVPQKAEQFISDLIPVNLEATLNLGQKTVIDEAFSEPVANFAQQLKSGH
jgi:flavodoxin